MARPLKQIDPEQVKELASIGCTAQEMAAVLKCHVDTVRDRFSKEIEEGRQNGKEKLRRLQWQAAMKGHWPALEFLGKQILGQSDKQEVSISTLTYEEKVQRAKELLEEIRADRERLLGDRGIGEGNTPPVPEVHD